MPARQTVRVMAEAIDQTENLPYGVINLCLESSP